MQKGLQPHPLPAQNSQGSTSYARKPDMQNLQKPQTPTPVLQHPTNKSRKLQDLHPKPPKHINKSRELSSPTPNPKQNPQNPLEAATAERALSPISP